MGVGLPYLATPGSITMALQKIRDAATPDRVTADFVTTKLTIKGGTGRAIPPFLKRINFVASDGTPTELYKSFRNKTTGGKAVAEAIKFGYHPLKEVNEYFYLLSDKDLKALIVQITGLDADDKIVKLTLSTLSNLKQFAKFEDDKDIALENIEEKEIAHDKTTKTYQSSTATEVGLTLTYTINLNLPATTDQAVFNAIFKSLKEHLLSNE